MIVQEFNVAARALKINTDRNRAFLRALEVSDLESFNNDVAVRPFKAEQPDLAATADAQSRAVNNCSLTGITHKCDVACGRISRVWNSNDLVVCAAHDLHGVARVSLAGRVIDVPPGALSVPALVSAPVVET